MTINTQLVTDLLSLQESNVVSIEWSRYLVSHAFELCEEIGDKPTGKNIRNVLRGWLAAHVKVAGQTDRSMVAKGFNCIDKGNSRYRQDNTNFLHFVKPSGGIEFGTRIESAVQQALRVMKDKKLDANGWLLLPDAKAFDTSKIKAAPSKKASKTTKAPKWMSSIGSEAIATVKRLSMTRAQATAWLASAETFAKAS